jgi:hypothetical protein
MSNLACYSSIASLPLGYSEPRYKLKLITGTQRSKTLSGTVGLAGGKPTAVVTPMAGKLTSSTTEVADEEVCLWGITIL